MIIGGTMKPLLQWGIRLGAVLTMVAALGAGVVATAGAQEANVEKAPADDRNWVHGRIEALGNESNSVIVDGRRFQFGAEVRYDGVVLERGEAIERLGPGDFVQIEHGDNYQGAIRSIHTRKR